MMDRTHYCGELRGKHIGTRAHICGWVAQKRDMGGVIFLDVRDREGVVQVVLNAQNLPPAEFHDGEHIKNQSVVSVFGVVRRRDAETYNPKLLTGEVELAACSLKILSEAKPLPFSLDEGAGVREDLRLQYRYLDIRRPAMYQALRFRSQVRAAAEEYLDQNGFLQVETPILTKSTPEGARDYLVPSRAHPGAFYALPQSPQVFKQLLMVGGIDKYYQVARCFRDEDLRADRQPEFTQIDMEMSFVDQEDILSHLEKLIRFIFQKAMGRPCQEEPFQRLTWREAMDTYGTDKPDLRFGLPILDVTDLGKKCAFSVFREAALSGGKVRALNLKGCGEKFTRSAIEELTNQALSQGAKGMAWIAVRESGEVNSILQKYFTKEEWGRLLTRLGMENGDFALFCADDFATVCKTLGSLRLAAADLMGLRKKGEFKFLFVTEFPQFEYSKEEGRWVAVHHPFTMPFEEDLPYLASDPGRVRSQAYDLVLNGVELGSGSIRIHRRDIQQRMFEALGFTNEQAQARFGFMLRAFQYGAPPHGGFAFGLDRLVMLLLSADSLRDVIAFPKARDASCPMTQAPDKVDPAQLQALKLDAVGGDQPKPRKNRPAVQVEKVAALAKLHLEPGEKERMEKELEAIISFAGQLEEADVEGLPAAAHVIPLENVFREDEPHTSYDRDALLGNAPCKDAGLIAVPRTVE